MSETSYKCTAQIVSDGGAKCSRYKSTKSGMTIIIAEVDGPLVGGYFCVATEAHDDDGLPHTLEHLVFLGSEKYPYKGFLDLVASRCLSQGTNAWTDTDHTCYTITTAGDEGFLNLLPIYLDHLLYPELKDSAFVTEVHHINKEGEDAGIVYAEMQARQNSGESRCHRQMLQSMYPGHCGYKSETGGIVQNLQESTTHEKVIAYHKEFYRPENLCLIIVGQIDANKVFEALKPVEERIAKDAQRPPFVRPWQTPVPPLPESVTLNVDFPTDEDEYGLVIAAWRGPLATDHFQLVSLQILMDYLTDTSVSPLARDLVEIEDPLCNEVDYTIIENFESCIYLHLSNVPAEKLEEAKEMCFASLKRIANGEEQLDMNRLRTVIRKKKMYILGNMENSPHDHLANCLIGDFLYGNTLEDLQNRLQEVPAIEPLFDEPASFWIGLLKKYITDNKYVVVLGMPNTELATTMANQEKERIQRQITKLGPSGLQEKGRILAAAIEDTSVKPPIEMLTAVSIPSSKSIKFHPIQRICNVLETEDKDVNFDIQKMPCRFQLDVIHTNFVRLYVLMDTSHLPLNLRLYLPLFVELLDECAIDRNGEIVPYQEIVKQLAEDTVSIFTNIGLNYTRFFCGRNAQIICLELMVEEEKYQKSVQWIHEILYKIVFEPARIKSSIKKITSDLAEMKRSGSSIARTIMKNLVYQPESNHWAASMMRQSKFLGKLLKELESNPDEVIANLHRLREMVTRPDKITVHLSLNLEALKKKCQPEQPWVESFFPKSVVPQITNSPIQKCHELIHKNGKNTHNGYIIGVGSLETSNLTQSTPGITSYKDPDYAPLLVLLQYLTQLEGPMWIALRGKGLTYSFGLYCDADSGLISFVISKSTHIVNCYKEAFDVVQSHLNGTTPWEQKFFEATTSSLVYDTIEAIKTASDTTEQSLKAYYAGVDMAFTRELLARISQVTHADLERVGKKYLKPLFDFNTSKCVICCPTNKVDEIVKEFKECSRTLVVLSSLEDEMLTKY